MNKIISCIDLKPYVAATRSCRLTTSGYELDPINSHLKLNLSSIEGDLVYCLLFKRLNGNGLVSIDTKNQSLNLAILSKASQKVKVLPNDNKEINIYRNKNSIGKIILYELIIENSEEIKDNMSDNLKQIISKCGQTKGIKLVGEKLLAMEGASIQNGHIIEDIITDPQNAYRKSDKITFIIPCEIKDIIISNSGSTKNNKNLYKHLEHPPKIKTNTNVYTDAIINNKSNYITSSINMNKKNDKNYIIYNSYETGLFSNILQQTNDIRYGVGENNKGVILGHKGRFTIPTANLVPNRNYVIVLKGQKLNGNGKTGVEITTNNRSSRSKAIKIFDSHPKEMFIDVNTGAPPSFGYHYVINVFRPENASSGDVLVDKVMILEGINASPIYHNKISLPGTQSINNFNILDNYSGTDLVSVTIKKYGRYSSYIPTEDLNFSHKGTFSISNTSAMSWFSKIKPLCPNLELSNNNYDSVLIGEIGSLHPAKKMWIDVFENNKFSDQDNDAIEKSEIISSPSLENIFFLKERFPNKKILHLERTWPIINTDILKYPSGEYIFLFNRNDSVTEYIIRSLNGTGTNVVILGYRKNTPNNVIPINEYISYNKVLSCLLQSRAVIDILINKEYMSSITSLVYDCGLPIITTDNFINNVINIKNTTKIENFDVPTEEEIKNSIRNLPNKNNINKELHNNKLKYFLDSLF